MGYPHAGWQRCCGNWFNYAEHLILSDEVEMCYSNENICHRTWWCVLFQHDKKQVSKNSRPQLE